jgi:hypothetical protein
VGGLAENVADPRFSTGVGLVLHAARQDNGNGSYTDTASARPRQRFDLWNWFTSRF